MNSGRLLHSDGTYCIFAKNKCFAFIFLVIKKCCFLGNCYWSRLGINDVSRNFWSMKFVLWMLWSDHLMKGSSYTVNYLRCALIFFLSRAFHFYLSYFLEPSFNVAFCLLTCINPLGHFDHLMRNNLVKKSFQRTANELIPFYCSILSTVSSYLISLWSKGSLTNICEQKIPEQCGYERFCTISHWDQVLCTNRNGKKI